MVIPNRGPVRIGDGPTIETRGGDLFDHVRVDGVVQYMPLPFPSPVPIHGTPYEAYALGGWMRSHFAIRLRTVLYEPDTCPDGTGCAFHAMRHVHPLGGRELP